MKWIANQSDGVPSIFESAVQMHSKYISTSEMELAINSYLTYREP